MQCPQCNAQLDDDAVFCGNCGKQVAPLQAKGATVGDKEEPGDSELTAMQGKRAALQTPDTRAYATTPDTPTLSGAFSALPTSKLPAQRTNIGHVALIAALVLLVIAGGTIGAVVLLRNNNAAKSNSSNNAALASNSSGVVSFSDIQNGSGHSDVVNISVNNLPAPLAGSEYDAWLIDTQSEHSVALGTLQAKNGSFKLNSADVSTNLLGAGDKVEITLENGTANVPTGQVLLSASFPPKAFVHIKHLLVSFPDTPGKIGLVVGVVDQAQKLSDASQLLQSIAASHNAGAIQCAAQSIIDIAEGTQGPHYQPLASQCAALNVAEIGDGYGLLGTNGYIANGEAHASLAATQTDSTGNIRVHARHVQICLENMKGWITTVDQDARALLNNPTGTTKVQEMVTLSNHALNGVDINGDESIDPVPGEGGAIIAYIHSQFMATLILAPGA